MTDAYRFDESSTEQAIAYAKIYAGENYSPAMETVLKVAFSEKRNLPTFRLKSSDTILQALGQNRELLRDTSGSDGKNDPQSQDIRARG